MHSQRSKAVFLDFKVPVHVDENSNYNRGLWAETIEPNMRTSCNHRGTLGDTRERTDVCIYTVTESRYAIDGLFMFDSLQGGGNRQWEGSYGNTTGFVHN